MTNEETKALWAQNITSREQFDDVFNRTRSHIGRAWVQAGNHLPMADHQYVHDLQHVSGDLWPLQRDIIRETVGFYPEPTSVIRWLRTVASNTGVGQMWPHVSPIDRTEIAFTPDPVQGRADRKQRMTIGRFLRKFLLWAPDREIQRLEQQHRSELDTSFKLAETVEAIYQVYREMDGDTGCMRYDEEHFGHEEYHPSAVYASPNMGVAYTTDVNGTVKSRSVVWINPADPDDKRYVRIYGDPILRKKLEANGYRMRGLAGAKLRILRDPSFDENNDAMIVMPWIDPAGGIHATNVDRAFDSEHAVRFKGEDFFTLVTGEQQRAYAKAGIMAKGVQTQDGHVEVPEIDLSTFHYTCLLTGKQANRMEVSTVLWVTEDGTVGSAIEAAVEEIEDRVMMRIHREGKLQYIYSTIPVRDKVAIPGMDSWFNDAPTRQAAGVCLLDSVFYPGGATYHARVDCVYLEGAGGVHTFIKKEDALMLYKEGGNSFTHVSMVKPLKSEGYLPVAVYNSYRGLAHRDHPRLAVTRGGKRVITDTHEVNQLVDGTWEYERNVVPITICGHAFRMSKTDVARDIVISAEKVRELFEPTYKLAYRSIDPDSNVDRRLRDQRMLRAFSNGFQSASTWFKSGDNIVALTHYNKPTEPRQLYEAALGILLMQKDSEWMQRTLGYQHANGPPWARVVKDAFEGMQAFDHERGMAMAEANAVEAAPTTAAVIATLNTLGDSEMDRLIAEVDDTLATAVVRRWPRLMAAGMMNRPIEEVPTHVAQALDRMEQVMGSPDGMGPQAVTADTPVRTVRNADGTVSELGWPFAPVAEPNPDPALGTVVTPAQVEAYVEGRVLNPAAAWPVPTTGRDPNTWPHAPAPITGVPDESWIEPAMAAVEASLPAPNFVIVPPASLDTANLLSHLQPASSALSLEENVARVRAQQAQEDDALLVELRRAGLAPIVIDESTSFSDLPNLNTERQE
jgi:hypothetical protein